MASSFRGADLFGSGPHRFSVGRQGQYVLPLAVSTGDVLLPGSAAYGDLEIEVIVRGRLVASTEAGLWALRDAVVAASASSLASGVLVDQHARTWADMKLIRYEEADRTDRGRVRSVGYVATFRRVSGPPFVSGTGTGTTPGAGDPPGGGGGA